ncbi:YceI family protein [Marivirga lumbricoides]|uniref:YceI family protein n=1 Tax=Marivirga lumbricoides TaxID=1046115 RepID=A0A2T4DRQ8_9BACT|nr:YceI family protein [Marivirga lumbricoides]
MKKLILIVFIFTLHFANAQQFKLNEGQTQLTVEGTSSLHDWTIEAEEFQGNAEIVLEGNQVGEIKSLTFKVLVKGLKSGKSAMDDNTYEALEAKSHPYITYQFKSIESKKKAGDKLVLTTKGNLTIAGETKVVNMTVTTDVSRGVEFDGSVSFNMTDFKVDPPTAVFGTIKTGNKVTINFKANYSK